MIIKDKKGHRLRLSSRRLTEVTGMETKYPFYALLADIRESFEDRKITRLYIHGKYMQGYEWRGSGYPSNIDPIKYKIGCRKFSSATFAKILKAAGVRKTYKKIARKKGKK